jgi:hypothetical protein
VISRLASIVHAARAMNRRAFRWLIASLPLIALLALAPRANAECTPSDAVIVQVSCRAELTGGKGAFTISQASKATVLKLGDHRIALRFGDYVLGADLICSGDQHRPMEWGFEVQLSRIGGMSPIHYQRLGGLDLLRRKRGPALSSSSYYFFDKAIQVLSPATQAMESVTRLDYTCELSVN